MKNLYTKEFVDFSIHTHKQIDVNKFVYSALTNGLGCAQTIRLLSETLDAEIIALTHKIRIIENSYQHH